MAKAGRWRILKYLILVCSLLGYLLRSTLYSSAVDEKGLLISGHWAGICLWCLTALVAGLLFLPGKPRKQTAYPEAFPPSGIRAAGAILAGVAFSICGISVPVGGNLGVAEVVLRFAAAASLSCVGFCRFTGRQPFFLFHGTVCVYMALRMVCQYRIWSADPQMMNYCFHLGAYLSLMLFAYHLAAWDADLPDHRKLWAAGLASVYLCSVTLADSTENFFLLCCGIWALTNLCRPVSHRKPTPSPDHDQEESL